MEGITHPHPGYPRIMMVVMGFQRLESKNWRMKQQIWSFNLAQLECDSTSVSV